MADDIHYRCAVEIQEGIQRLDLKDLPADQVYRRKVLTDRNTTLPCVIVFLPPVSEVELPGTNERNDWGLLVGVAIIAASNQDYDLDQQDETYLGWRRRIRQRFHNQRMQQATEIYDVKWQPAQVLELGLWEQAGLWVQGGLLLCKHREQRGI